MSYKAILELTMKTLKLYLPILDFMRHAFDNNNYAQRIIVNRIILLYLYINNSSK